VDSGGSLRYVEPKPESGENVGQADINRSKLSKFGHTRKVSKPRIVLINS
jgi:hypothetical protein